MQLINVVIVLTTLISPAHAVEQNAAVQTDTAPIENPPLPLLLNVTGDNPAVLISAFRHQHGEGSVAISAALTGLAQEQANAMAMRDSLDHNVLAPFSNRIGRSGFSHAAENIAFGHADFASTLDQWTNSAGHRANLLLHGAKWIGVAHAQNGHRIYWAMVIGAEIKRKAASYADRVIGNWLWRLAPRAARNVRCGLVRLVFSISQSVDNLSADDNIDACWMVKTSPNT